MLKVSITDQLPRLGPDITRRYLRAGYRLIGAHSGIQICRWTRAALTGQRHCYKRWYGVESHRCLQLTPALQFCNLRCVFCWRIHSPDRYKPQRTWDSPSLILDNAISAQRKLLSGFKANPHVTQKRFEEALKPRHVAISLDGEPTLYPMIEDLIQEIRNRRMSSFLVTNGTMPERLIGIVKHNSEPTNLYVSLCGPDRLTYQNVSRPLVPDTWDRICASLRVMSRFVNSRTILRLTLVKGQNMHAPRGYSRLVAIANPMLVELKGYSWLGESKHRLPIGAMPFHTEVREFAKRIEDGTGYRAIAEDEVSRVVVLARDTSSTEFTLDVQ